MVNNAVVQLKIALAPGCDTSNIIYKAITDINNITISKNLSQAEAAEALEKGRLTAIVDIKRDSANTILHHFDIHIASSASSADEAVLLQTLLNNTIKSMDEKTFPANPSIASLSVNELPGRSYKRIDFILPGQLGFSLLMAGVFGSAFLLFNLRKSLVLKRLSATPVSRIHIILGEMLSRLFFHLMSFIIIVSLGYFVFDFTLVNGLLTFFEMLVFSLLGLVIFMGIGFIISGVLQNESSVTPVANTITLPQILLCGLFFPIENYPHWLQSFCNILPLTLFVGGLRKIAFEGTHIWQMPTQILGLFAWAIVILFVCVKSFKWE
jgi:ABC-2 type transport system permease protein